jgi:hypothetical protein
MMSFAGSVLGLVMPAIAVRVLIGRLSPVPSSLQRQLGLAVFSLLIGIGAASLWTFAWMIGSGTLGASFLAADVGLWTILTMSVAFAARSPLGSDKCTSGSPRQRLAPLTVIAGGLLVFALFVAVAHLVRVAEWLPHGDYDAWAIWNHRARCIFRAAGTAQGPFHGCTAAQLEYPLLIPLSVARLWAYAGETTAAPLSLAFTFTLAGALIVAFAVSRVSGDVAGAAAGLLILGTPRYLYWGAVQMADIPVAAMVAAGVAALLVGGRGSDRSRNRWITLAGFLLASAGWTKDEGLAAAAVAFLVRLGFSWRASGRRVALAEARWLSAGALLPAVAWVVFHLLVAPGVAPALSQPAWDALAKLTDPDRWRLVLLAMAEAFPGGRVALPLGAVVVALLLGATPRTLVRSEALWIGVAMYVVYIIVFVVTPQPLQWHLDTAAIRLVLQPWPTMILGLLAAGTPARTGAEPGGHRLASSGT